MPTSAEPDGHEAVRALLGYGVSTVHEAMGRRGLASGLTLRVGPAFAGPAVTVHIPAGDNLGIHAALTEAPPGSVICVASQGRGVFGVLGELIAVAARARGVAGFVVDDGVRDVGLLEAPPGIAARGVMARGTVKRRVLAIHEPVALGGILVCPGDWVLADRDGVCVVPRSQLGATLAAAAARTHKEDRIREALQRGQTTVTVLGLEAVLEGRKGVHP